MTRFIIIAFLFTISSCGLDALQINHPFDFLHKKSSDKDAPAYMVGTGIADITGPASGVQMMGYIRLGQTTEGIHLRLRSRAFIFGDLDLNDRVVFVQADIIHLYQGVSQQVLKKLQEKYGDTYTEKNVVLTANHTHSGPGNYSHYRLYNLMYQFSHNKQNFDAIVNGIVDSVVQAHERLDVGHIYVSRGRLENANINRAPEAYDLNHDADQYSENIDREMTQLKLTKANGTPIGVMNWFPVHAVSMKNDNKLISSDNKGYAAMLMEKQFGTNYVDRDLFVAGFFNGAAGDASPNVAQDVNGDGEWNCAAIDNFACTKRSAEKHLSKAMDLYHQGNVPVGGDIDSRHSYVNFSKVVVRDEFTRNSGDQTTCPAAIGISMLAGTADGRGIGWEGVDCSSLGPVMKAIFCKKKRACHGEKAIALSTGYSKKPWTPQVLPVQVVRLGQVAFVAAPAEFTTMAGRRVLKRVQEDLQESGVDHVVFAGFANAYSGYVATQEEYQSQNYESASTHFGEWTNDAYVQEFSRLATDMALGVNSDPGPTPDDKINDVVHQSQPKSDRIARGARFGEVVNDVGGSYGAGDVVKAIFHSANLSHDFRTNDSYAFIQKQEGDRWKTVAYDWDWSTKVFWIKSYRRSQVRIEWAIPDNTPAGTYRIVHKASAKRRDASLHAFEGVSGTFQVN